MTRHAPLGRATELGDMLLGKAPYGHSPQRDVYSAFAGMYPALITGDRDRLLAECGGSREWAELVRAGFRSAAARLTRLGKREEEWFVVRLHACWVEMRRLLEQRVAVEIDLDIYSGDDTLGDLRDRLCLHLTRYGQAEAIAALPAIVWAYARSSGEGEERLLHTAIGASISEDQPWRLGTWRPNGELLDVVGTWAQIGAEAVRGLAPRPAQPRVFPSHVQAIVAARKAEVPDGPSLLVLASVEHLPGGARDGQDKPGSLTGSTPRTEWAPVAGRRLPLVIVPDLARVKRRLVAEFPDCTRIIDTVLAPLAGRQFAWLPPILFRGAPGSGKSRLARRLGEELGLTVTVYGCAGVADGSFIGTSRQWSTGRASVPLQAIKRAGAANVLVVLDELPRAGTRQDNGRLTDGVLGMLERETAKAVFDPYLECAVDLSAVSYVATANDTSDLDPALLSRFRVYDVPLPSLVSLPVLAKSIVGELRRDRGLDERWLPDCTPEEIDLVAQHWRGGSVRVLQALVECAVDNRHTGPAN